MTPSPRLPPKEAAGNAALALILVAAINFALALIEGTAGLLFQSQALLGDALDFLEDTATAGLAFWAIHGTRLRQRRVATVQGLAMMVLGFAVIASTVWRAFAGHAPAGTAMTSIGLLALAANILCVLILLRVRNVGINVRAVWIAGYNDVFGNVGVIGSGALIAATGWSWPDLAVGFALGCLFLWSAYRVLRSPVSDTSS